MDGIYVLLSIFLNLHHYPTPFPADATQQQKKEKEKKEGVVSADCFKFWEYLMGWFLLDPLI